MANLVHALHIIVRQSTWLQNGVNGGIDLQPGNYIAFPQAGSSPLAYDLWRADESWRPTESIGAAFINVTPQGDALLS